MAESMVKEQKKTRRPRLRPKAVSRDGRAMPLKWSLYAMIIFCWILPLSATLLISSLQTEENTRSSIESTILSSASYGISILEERFAEAMEDSRAASYDGIIANAYEEYQKDGDRVALYDASNAYLANQYAHNNLFEAVYLIYSEVPDTPVYIFSRDAQGMAESARDFKAEILEKLLERGETLGTRIAFLPVGDQLFMVRNIVNNHFSTYAVLIMQCSKEYLFESARNLVWAKDVAVVLNGEMISVLGEEIPELRPGLRYDSKEDVYLLNGEVEVESQTASLLAVVSGDLLAQERENFHVMLLIAVLVSGGLLTLMVHFFYRNISRPVDDLVEAMEYLERGKLGHHVQGQGGNREFKYLNDRFNDLSDQLKEQFERNNMEQMALHEARIKALQSQINPHFLNNTLELINWEARMADDQKVCRMIEALSVMLNAAMARGGRATVNMREELSYIDAYLYIISQRLGERLTVHRQIQEEIMEAEVPRLILQPIVENAVEHGISLRAKGELTIRLYRQDAWLIMDVEHDGAITPKDRETIDQLLSWDGKEHMTATSAHIGIRNVNQRLKILYGEDSGLTLEEIRPNYVRSRIRLPFIESKRTEQ